MSCKRSILRGGLVAAFLSSALVPAVAETVDVTFLLVNDLYKMSGDKTRGGFARLAAVARAERAKGGNLLYVHAGDAISPSLMSGFDQGAHVIELLNVVPPDLFVPGNHEFDFGPEVFLKRLGESKFPWYAANIASADGKPLPQLKGPEIRDMGGVKVGIVPLAADDSPSDGTTGDLKFASTVETGPAVAADLRKQGAEFILGVVHADRTQDRTLYDSGAFDVILSGDDHDLALFFDGKKVLAESSEEANFVTAIDVKFDVEEADGKRTVTWFPNFRIIDTATVTADPETQKVVEKYEAELSSELDVKIGTTAVELDSRKATVRSTEAAIGNLVADAMKDAVGAEIAIANGGGIRGNKVYDAGSDITRRDILTELPFGNRTVLLELTGEDVWKAIENGVSQVENAAGRFPQVAGMTATFDLSKPVGERVISVEVAGAPIDKAKVYKVATNDYMALGGDGYKSFKNGKVLIGEREAKLLANDVMAYVRKVGTVQNKVEGRLVAK